MADNIDYEPVKIETSKYNLTITDKGFVSLVIIYNKAKNDIYSINFNLSDVVYFTKVPKGEYNFSCEFKVILKYNSVLSLYFNEGSDRRIIPDKLVNTIPDKIVDTIEDYLIKSVERRGEHR